MNVSLTCAFSLIILCVSSEVLWRMSLLYFTFQNMKVFKSYLLFSPRKCNKNTVNDQGVRKLKEKVVETVNFCHVFVHFLRVFLSVYLY